LAALYLDANVSRHIVGPLERDGHDVLETHRIGQSRAWDNEQLLLAAESGRIFVTHNFEDFRLLHAAWTLWSAAWGVAPSHAGILVLDQHSHQQLALTITAFIQRGLPLRTQLYRWQHVRGWSRLEPNHAWTPIG
jgi:hypothetical protein